jgi:hypothetical protein
LDAENDLEDDILRSIDEQHADIKDICMEMHLKYEELPAIKQIKQQMPSILLQDEMLRNELKRLSEHKNKRLEALKKLTKAEAELCSKLGLKKSEIRSIVPSEAELNSLDKRIKDLDMLLGERKQKMQKIKDEVTELSQDLDVSGSDSFAEIILFESIDEMQLSEAELSRAGEFREHLRAKNLQVVSDIKDFRIKICELWAKLDIENLNLKPILLGTRDQNGIYFCFRT